MSPTSRSSPGTQLAGSTVVEAGACVGPGCTLRDTAVGNGAALMHAVGVSAVVGPGVTVGPSPTWAADELSRERKEAQA